MPGRCARAGGWWLRLAAARRGLHLAAALAPLSALLGCNAPPDAGWSGYVEGEFVYVAAPLGGALVQLAVQRGQSVTRGSPLFALDAQPERDARDETAARLAVARAQAEDATKGRRADEIAVVRAQLAQARAAAGQADAALERQEQLVAQGFVSALQLDDLRAAAAQARERVAELQASLRVAALPARSDQLAAAQAGAVAAKAALAQSNWRERQKLQTAPTDALVFDSYFVVGEWVNAGQPVVALLPPGNTRARFFVPEAQVGRLALGQPVLIHCDGCGAPIAARIDRIAVQPEYTPPVIYSNAQRARLVFLVEARPDPKDGLRLKPGQPVDVHRTSAP